jgi:hypothetical protein
MYLPRMVIYGTANRKLTIIPLGQHLLNLLTDLSQTGFVFKRGEAGGSTSAKIIWVGEDSVYLGICADSWGRPFGVCVSFQ